MYTSLKRPDLAAGRQNHRPIIVQEVEAHVAVETDIAKLYERKAPLTQLPSQQLALLCVCVCFFYSSHVGNLRKKRHLLYCCGTTHEEPCYYINNSMIAAASVLCEGPRCRSYNEPFRETAQWKLSPIVHTRTARQVRQQTDNKDKKNIHRTQLCWAPRAPSVRTLWAEKCATPTAPQHGAMVRIQMICR